MIAEGTNDIIAIYAGTEAVNEVYVGTEQVWGSASSCFGSGAWNNDLPWSNEEGWVN